MPPSTSWQNPCVVAIVAASNPASARTRRACRRGDLVARAGGEQFNHLVAVARRRAGQRAGQAALSRDEPLAHALAQLAGGHPREGHEQQLVERRALRDVSRGKGGDRERLAGPGAGLEHGHAGRQRSADVERPDIGREVRQRSLTSSQASRPSQVRRARRPKRVVSAASQPSPASSAWGGSASSSAKVSAPPNTSVCSRS